MKLIVADDIVYKFFIEYMNTFDGYIVIVKSQICNYDLSKCEELIAVQRGNWLSQETIKSLCKISVANTEQLCDNLVKERVNNELLELENLCGYKITLYDYSDTNIQILNNMGFETKYHPYISLSNEMNYLNSLHIVPKLYDIGFVGCINERRRKILDELENNNITVRIIESFGNERDNQLAQCRYILNIHWASNFDIFESIRCNRWIQTGFKIITETSIEIFDPLNVFSAPYDDLVQYIKSIIKTNSELNQLSNYIKSCIQPIDNTEFLHNNIFNIDIYNKLKQDGILFIDSNIDRNAIDHKADIVRINNSTILRKNNPLQIEWLKEDGTIIFDLSNGPIYRRFIPPPIETINHIFIISKIISATSNKDKNYIEYGVRNGDSVEPISKLVKTVYSVDLNDYLPKNNNIEFFKMLTDTFSENHLKNINFDYAFIDADHSSTQVVTDFINIYKYINRNGYIFLHDTYPCNKELLRQDYCNDCYLSPIKIRQLYPDIEMLTIPINPGLTIIHKK